MDHDCGWVGVRETIPWVVLKRRDDLHVNSRNVFS